MRFLALLSLLPACVTTTLGRTRFEEKRSTGACTSVRKIELKVGWQTTSVVSTVTQRCDEILSERFEVRQRSAFEFGPKGAIIVAHTFAGGLLLGYAVGRAVTGTKSSEPAAVPVGLAGGFVGMALGMSTSYGVLTLPERATDRTEVELVAPRTTSVDVETRPADGVLKLSASAPEIRLVAGEATVSNAQLLELDRDQLEVGGERVPLDSATFEKVLAAQACARVSSLSLDALSSLSPNELSSRIGDARHCPSAPAGDGTYFALLNEKHRRDLEPPPAATADVPPR